MLAVRIGNPDSLRACEDHAWNEVEGTIIDITATQFSSKIRGVYVGESLIYHKRIIASGLAAYREIIDWGSYWNEPNWGRLSTHWI